MSSKYDNNGQYSRHSILRYEMIFGDGFVSSGGAKITREFCDLLRLSPQAKVLDIGSGLGGAAFYIAEKFQAQVLGVDLTTEMVEIATERAREKNARNVTFQCGDVRQMDFMEGRFDLIWSRDSLLHIPEKKELFAKAYKWLSVGGQVMFSDYAKSDKPHSAAFDKYVKDSGYDLHDVKRYGELLRDAGFVEVVSTDWTDRFVQVLQEEKHDLQTNRSRFVSNFSEQDLDYLVQRWDKKIEFCQSGDMKVGLWHARRLGK